MCFGALTCHDATGNVRMLFLPLPCHWSQVLSWGMQGVTVFFLMFSKQFLLYHKEGVKCWPGWYFICLVIYVTTIDDSFISIPFTDLEIFSIQWIKSGVKVPTVQVPTEQVPCKTTGISNLHSALHTHMLTNAKSAVTFEIGIIHW